MLRLLCNHIIPHHITVTVTALCSAAPNLKCMTTPQATAHPLQRALAKGAVAKGNCSLPPDPCEDMKIPALCWCPIRCRRCPMLRQAGCSRMGLARWPHRPCTYTCTCRCTSQSQLRHAATPTHPLPHPHTRCSASRKHQLHATHCSCQSSAARLLPVGIPHPHHLHLPQCTPL